MPETISEQQRYWSYVNCTYSVGAKSVNARPVCKKLVQEGEIEPPLYTANLYSLGVTAPPKEKPQA